MRSFEGQHSDSQPHRRTDAQKRALVSELESVLKTMRPTASIEHRTGVRNQIAKLRAELDGTAPAAALPEAARRNLSDMQPTQKRFGIAGATPTRDRSVRAVSFG